MNTPPDFLNMTHIAIRGLYPVVGELTFYSHFFLIIKSHFSRPDIQQIFYFQTTSSFYVSSISRLFFFFFFSKISSLFQLLIYFHLMTMGGFFYEKSQPSPVTISEERARMEHVPFDDNYNNEIDWIEK